MRGTGIDKQTKKNRTMPEKMVEKGKERAKQRKKKGGPRNVVGSAELRAFMLDAEEEKVGSRFRGVRFSATSGTGERNGFLFHLSRSHVHASATVTKPLHLSGGSSE